MTCSNVIADPLSKIARIGFSHHPPPMTVNHVPSPKGIPDDSYFRPDALAILQRRPDRGPRTRAPAHADFGRSFDGGRDETGDVQPPIHAAAFTAFTGSLPRGYF
jgi:hypothetical protein